MFISQPSCHHKRDPQKCKAQQAIPAVVYDLFRGDFYCSCNSVGSKSTIGGFWFECL